MSTLLQALKPAFQAQQNWIEQRTSAWNALEKSGLPGLKDEEWKYTSLQNLDSQNFQVIKNTTIQVPGLEILNRVDAYTIILVNGELSSHQLPDTIQVSRLSAAPESIQNSFWNAPSLAQQDPLTQLNVAVSDDPIVLRLPAGKSLDKPVHLVHLLDASQKQVFSASRLLVHVEKNARLSLIESFHTFGSLSSFSNNFTQALLEQDAHLSYYKIQQDTGDAHHVGTTEVVHLGKSTSHSVTISLQGTLIRNNFHLIFKAPHSEGHMYGLYMSGGEQHIDNHTIADHAVPHCFSNELYKGILDGSSTGVFNGKIFVRQDAQKTNAFQSNKNVLLSQDAKINTKPQLEIFADDVKCSHGATTGQLDESALFYMRARGIGEEQAKALLMQAFANDILEKVEFDDLRALLLEAIEKRLLK
ncbi:MAG: Fe-S cluster assembly protein SufD [Cytophagaceae bacterium]|jgi:Fe-S cluster assembly protein SufD|nr:Fe-S cluster assembly protein SufD [Cytophagaceae bacterium]